MAAYDYVIERFLGLDQSEDESLTPRGCTHDAVNMDTAEGRLSVCGGFTRLIAAPVPGTAPISRAVIFRSSAKDIPVAVSGGKIYAYGVEGASWTLIHSVEAEPVNPVYSMITAQIGTTDCLIIADGRQQMLKYDGASVTAFGSEAGCSNIACGSIAMYRGRLFAAGDSEHPNRLYYSQLPGGDRSIENWGYVEDSPSVEGGHVEIGTTGGDPVTALAVLSSMLVIFKKHSLYRLIGDRPSNFTVERIASLTGDPAPMAMAVAGDVLYFLTNEGLFCFNGVDAAPMPDIRRIRTLMRTASITRSHMAAVGQKLYFTVKRGAETKLIEYDLTERKYLQYAGFEAYELIDADGRPAIVSGTRRICRWGEGGSFDGAPIAAHWRVPATDLGDRASIKTLRRLYLRGTGSDVLVTSETDGVTRGRRLGLPESAAEVAELPLEGEGRTFALTLANEGGESFCLRGGLQLTLSVRRRTE